MEKTVSFHMPMEDLAIYKGFIASLPEAACIVRASDNKIIIVNEVFYELMDGRQDELIETDIRLILFPEEGTIWDHLTVAIQLTGKHVRNSFTLENRNRTRFQINISAGPVELFNQLHYLVILTDNGMRPENSGSETDVGYEAFRAGNADANKMPGEVAEKDPAVGKKIAETDTAHNSLVDLVKERTAELKSNNLKLAKEIVDRRAVEKALVESDRKFRDIVQNVPGIIFQLRIRKDGSNYFSFMSPKAFEVFDLPDDLQNFESSLIEHIHPADRADFILSFSKVITGFTDWNFEGRFITVNHGVKWFHGLTSQSFIGEEMILDGLILDITNRKKAEDALARSEKKYRNLFDSMTEAFMVCEIIFSREGSPVNFKFLETNRAWELQTGLQVGNIRGKTVKEVIPDLEQHWIDRYAETVRSGKTSNFEAFNKSTNRYYRVHSFKIEGNTFAALFSDITHQKHVEEYLREMLTKYRVLFESFPLGLTISDNAGKIIESNEEAERLLGISEEIQMRRHIDGQEWKIIRTDGTIMPKEEYPSVIALKTRQRVENIEMGIVKDNDDISWVNVTAAPLPLKDGRLIITYGDITARKQTEHALQESEHRYRALFNAMKDGFALHQVIYDKEGSPVDYRFIDINPAFEELTGLKRSEVIGRTLHEVLPEEDPSWVERYSSVARTGIPVNFENYSPMLDRYYDVYSYRSARDQFAVIFRDITEMKKGEKEVKKKAGTARKK